VRLHTLANANGLRVRVATLGATLVSIEAPDRDGRFSDIALGYATVAEYLAGTAYFGAVVGRVANRIARGRFTLDGVTHSLATNNAPAGIPCSLHGGGVGFDKVLWEAAPVGGDGAAGIVLTYQSRDGEEGYPGNLRASVTYALLPDNTLRVSYDAATDRATPVNLSQHSYFNLGGEGCGRDILGHTLQLHAAHYTPVTPGLIPTGEIAPVAGTPFDFTRPHPIGERIGATHPQLAHGAGYDHNWVLNGDSGQLRPAAEVHDAHTGRLLRISTTEPGIQFYSGNFLNGTDKGKAGRPYAHRAGFALETQHFPDTPNQPSFPGITLQPGRNYHSVTEYCFGVR
jgi:aldose 1-epimerase